MYSKVRFISFSVLIGVLFAFLFGTVARARLQDSGMDQEEIRLAWSNFSKEKSVATVKGGYPYMSCFEAAAQKYGLPLPLLLAVARGESDFDPMAVSDKDCLGIMQIQWPGTAKELGFTKREDLFDPCLNIDAGARYLSMLRNKFDNDLFLTVAAYNYGPNAVRAKRVPEGAGWYAAYIYRHLESVLENPYEERGRLLVLGFTFYKRAVIFMNYLKNQVPGVPFDIFKSRRYTYDVVITYKDTKEKQTFSGLLRQKTGLTPLERKN